MPELPEVETISKYLNRKIPGLKIRDFWTDWSKAIKLPKKVEDFKKEIIGREVLKVYRKGKNILFDLSGGKMLLVHQKMTGHFLIGQWKIEKQGRKEVVVPMNDGFLREKVNNYIHDIFYLSDGSQLALSDLRKFAKLMVGDKEKIQNLSDLKDLGPDPLEVSEKEFIDILKNKKGRIKQVLMDQSVFAGIGNIYSDEILWFAKIHPFARTEELKEKNLKNIFKYTKEVLEEGIKLRGTSISDYRDPEGRAGGYDKIRRVYRREGEKCPRCKTAITRIKIGSRSAHYCTNCQKD